VSEEIALMVGSVFLSGSAVFVCGISKVHTEAWVYFRRFNCRFLCGGFRFRVQTFIVQFNVQCAVLQRTSTQVRTSSSLILNLV